MSYSFHVRTAEPPDMGLFHEVGPGVAFSEEDVPATGALPSGYLHIYRQGRSTRGVEVCHEDGAFQVRIMTCSSPEDYELALGLVRSLAARLRVDVESEEGVSFAPADERQYGPEWIHQHVEWGTKISCEMALERGTLQMSGPRRTTHVGPRLVAELDAAGPPESRGARLLDAIRRVQFIDEQRYYAASILSVRDKDGGGEFRVAAWAPGVGYLFPEVDYLHVLAEGDASFAIAMADAVRIPGVEARYLDEVQVLAEPVPDEAWEAFLDRARRFATKPERKRRAP